MKKRLVLIILLLQSSLVFAEIKEGKYSLAVNVGITQGESVDFSDFDSFSFHTSGMYFLTENVGLGLGFTYRRVTIPEASFSDVDRKLSGEIRWYPKLKTFHPFVGVLSQYVLPEDKFSRMMLGVNAGINYFLSENVAVEPVFAIMEDNHYNAGKQDGLISITSVSFRLRYFFN